MSQLKVRVFDSVLCIEETSLDSRFCLTADGYLDLRTAQFRDRLVSWEHLPRNWVIV